MLYSTRYKIFTHCYLAWAVSMQKRTTMPLAGKTHGVGRNQETNSLSGVSRVDTCTILDVNGQLSRNRRGVV